MPRRFHFLTSCYHLNVSFPWFRTTYYKDNTEDTLTMSYQTFLKRLSKEEENLYETKKAAAEFYRVNRIPEEIERALNELFIHNPEDVYGYLVWLCFIRSANTCT